MHILCTICSDLVDQAENIHVTKCGHIFHYRCLAKWIKRSKSCPQCRHRVTEECMFRVYPTISNETSGEDATKLQSRLDDAQLQLRQHKANEKEKFNKLTDLKRALSEMIDVMKLSEIHFLNEEATMLAINERLMYASIAIKDNKKLKEENETFKKNIQTLKGALCESELQKNESRDRLVTVKQHLEMVKTELQMRVIQTKEQYTAILRKYEALKNKRKATEEMDRSLFEDSLMTAAKQQRPSDEPLFNDSTVINESNTSLNTLVKRIENADFPYHALATLQRPAMHMFVDSYLKPSEYAMLNTERKNATERQVLENKPSSSHSQSFEHFPFHSFQEGTIENGFYEQNRTQAVSFGYVPMMDLVDTLN